jgi:hypothetical protein
MRLASNPLTHRQMKKSASKSAARNTIAAVAKRSMTKKKLSTAAATSAVMQTPVAPHRGPAPPSSALRARQTPHGTITGGTPVITVAVGSSGEKRLVDLSKGEAAVDLLEAKDRHTALSELEKLHLKVALLMEKLKQPPPPQEVT